jgi:hypothetical protein
MFCTACGCIDAKNNTDPRTHHGFLAVDVRAQHAFLHDHHLLVGMGVRRV